MESTFYQTSIFQGSKFYRQYLLGIIFYLLLSVTAYAQGGLKDIIVEKIPVSVEARNDDPTIPEGAYAYRVFVEMDTAYELQAVFSLEAHEMFLETSTQFYNNADFGAMSGGDILSALLASFPALAFDSYITINAATNNMLGVMKAEDTSDGTVDGMVSGSSLPLQTVGANFDVPFGTEPYSGRFSTFTGIFAVIGGETGPTPTNKVLIGQFTTEGEFSFELNVQIRKRGTTQYEQYVARDPQEQEILFEALTYTPNFPPTVTLTSPENGSSFITGDEVDITADASDEDGIASVAFFVNGTKIYVDSIVPYQTNWLALEGNASILAVATDSIGLTDTSNIVVINIGNLISPTVTISSPTSGASFLKTETITITANASDTDGSVSLVEFFADEVKLGEDNTSPYQWNWNNGTPGSYNLSAVATDNDGLQDTSAIIIITVTEPTGFHYPDNDGSISVFPNPVKDKITIEFSGMSGHAKIQAEVMSVQGGSYIKREIYISDNRYSTTIDISSLPEGVYLIRLVDDNEHTIYKKIIKN